MNSFGLLIDFDGTLIDSETMHQRSIKTWLVNRGWDDPTYPGLFLGRRAIDVFAETTGPWTGMDPDELTKEIWLSATYQPIDPIQGAPEFLQWAEKHSFRRALVTSGTKWWVELGLKDSGLPITLSYFDAAITAEFISTGKPDPTGYRMAIDALQVAPGRCCVLEDTPAGVQAGRNAGAGFVIGLATSQHSGGLMEAGADVVLPDLLQAPELIQHWASH